MKAKVSGSGNLQFEDLPDPATSLKWLSVDFSGEKMALLVEGEP